MNCQDAYEDEYDDHGELLPTVKYNNPYQQIDIMRDNLQKEYAAKCFAPPAFPFVEVAAGFVLGVALTLIIGGLV